MHFRSIALAPYGLYAVYASWRLHKLFRRQKLVPSPVTDAFISDLAINIARRVRRQHRARRQYSDRTIEQHFNRTCSRVKGMPVGYYDAFDDLMTKHNIAPLPPLVEHRKGEDF